MNQAEVPGHDVPANPGFYAFLTQALTLGARSVSKSRFPQFTGFLVYTALVGLLVASVTVDESETMIVGSIVLLSMTGILAILLLMGTVIYPLVLNLLVVVVVLGFLANAGWVAYALTASDNHEADDVRVWGNIFSQDSVPVIGATVSAAGDTREVRTGPGGFFELTIRRSAVEQDTVTLIVQWVGPVALYSHRLTNRPIRLFLVSRYADSIPNTPPRQTDVSREEDDVMDDWVLWLESTDSHDLAQDRADEFRSALYRSPAVAALPPSADSTDIVAVRDPRRSSKHMVVFDMLPGDATYEGQERARIDLVRAAAVDSTRGSTVSRWVKRSKTIRYSRTDFESTYGRVVEHP